MFRKYSFNGDLARKLEEDDMIQVAEQQEILRMLLEHGITDEKVATDGSRFFFYYNGLCIDFVNYGDRLEGDIYKLWRDQEELEYIEETDFLLLDSEEKLLFQHELNYRNFIFTGPISQTVKNVLELAKLPLDKALQLADENGCIDIVDMDLKKIIDPGYDANKEYQKINKWIDFSISDYF